MYINKLAKLAYLNKKRVYSVKKKKYELVDGYKKLIHASQIFYKFKGNLIRKKT